MSAPQAGWESCSLGLMYDPSRQRHVIGEMSGRKEDQGEDSSELTPLAEGTHREGALLGQGRGHPVPTGQK